MKKIFVENGHEDGIAVNAANNRRRAGCVLLALCVVFVCAVFGVSAQDDVLVSGGKSCELGDGTITDNYAAPRGYTADLTDGVAISYYDSSEEHYSDWFAFYYVKNPKNSVQTSMINAPGGVGEMTVDLGEVKTNLNRFRAHLVTANATSVYQPQKIEVYASETHDGTFVKVAENGSIASDNVTDWFEMLPSAGVTARYVRFAFVYPETANIGMILLDELEVYTGASGSASSEAASETASETTSEAASEPSGTSSEESLGDPRFEVTLGNPGEWVEGEKFEVTASVTDVSVTGGIYIVSFVLQYDPAKIRLLNEESEDGSLFVETNLPGEDWENLTHVDRDSGLIEVEFSNPSGSEVAAVNDGDIALAFTFIAEDGITGNVAVSVKANSAVAGDRSFNRYAGRTTDVSIPKGHIPSWIEVEHRNCGHSGVRHCYCSVCGKLLETETLAPTGEHTPGEWTVTREAKYGVAGSREKRCTVCGKVVATEIIPAIIYPKGDINGNGVIDAQDYAMAKRSVLGTYRLTEAQAGRGDIDSNGKVDAWDYAKIKRHFLGTYVIEN